MKNLKETNSRLASNRVSAKLSVFGFIATFILIFYSCSSEDDSLNKSGGASKTKTESVKSTTENSVVGVPAAIEENLSSLSVQIFVNVASLEVALNKNSYVGFNAQAMQKLNTAKNESELKIAFEMGGIANSQEVINVLKNNVAIQQVFISQNPGFYNLTVEKQTQLLNTHIELVKNSYNSQVPIPPTGLVGNPNCASTFNKSINRCAGDFGTCAVFAVAGAYAGLAPGLLAAAYCMVTKISCDSRAKEDYKECVLEPMNPDGPPPPTGEITMHCDRDSCWTTDSNGKYIERVD